MLLLRYVHLIEYGKCTYILENRNPLILIFLLQLSFVSLVVMLGRLKTHCYNFCTGKHFETILLAMYAFLKYYPWSLCWPRSAFVTALSKMLHGLAALCALCSSAEIWFDNVRNSASHCHERNAIHKIQAPSAGEHSVKYRRRRLSGVNRLTSRQIPK